MPSRKLAIPAYGAHFAAGSTRIQGKAHWLAVFVLVAN
jgi:hypothetical protein